MNRLAPIAPKYSHSALGVYPFVFASFVLIVLVVFVVGTPILCHGRPLLLPAVASPTLYLDGGDLVHVSVQRDGRLFIEARSYSVPELPDELAKAVLLAPRVQGPGVVLRLDRDLSFSSVRRVLRLLADAGASRVMLQLEQSDGDTFLPGT